MTMKKNIYLFITIISYSIFFSHCFAQVDAQATRVKLNETVESVSESSSDLSSEQSFEQIKMERLVRIRSEIVETQNQIYSIKRQLKSETDSISKLKQESDLEKLELKQDQLRFQFIETVSNINLEKKPEQSVKTDLSEDIKQIIDPVITGFKKISERPREIQNLKEKIDFYKARIKDAKKAIQALKAYLEKLEDKSLKITIEKSIKLSKGVKKEFEIQLEDAQFNLIKLEKNEESIVTTFGGVIFDFIKTKGKNLILALLVFGLFFWGLSLGQDKIISLVMSKIRQEAQYPGQVHWMIRPLKVAYGLFTFITAFFFGVTTLYVLNDWVLVTLILFMLAAIIWSSKHYIPQYFEQFKIVLNLGAVREGERLVYNDLPWKIKALGYYCRLVNPALSGGFIRVSSKELLSLHSRPVGDTEPWFPTRKDDWVELSDGTFGKVVLQTPELVEIKMIGDEHKYLPTKDFIGMNPINLSQGFAIEFDFGVDYSHQKVIFTELIPNFINIIKERIDEDFKENKAYFKELSIDFKSAGASSLDLRFFLKCDGPLAAQKRHLARKINSYFVEVCNTHDYIIPFNQLTVHMQK